MLMAVKAQIFSKDEESSLFYTSVSAGGHMEEETWGARVICNSGETVLL
jgi:hypothetical protein